MKVPLWKTINSCSPWPAMHTTGPGRLKISFCTPPMEKIRISRALVAAAPQPCPKQTAWTSSSLGRSTIHSLFVSQDEKCKHWSLLFGKRQIQWDLTRRWWNRNLQLHWIQGDRYFCKPTGVTSRGVQNNLKTINWRKYNLMQYQSVKFMDQSFHQWELFAVF